MVKLIALYTRPPDPEAFLRHYRDVHTPLLRRLPGLQRLEVACVTGAPRGGSPYFLVAEMYFRDGEALAAALKSEAGREAGGDLMGFARDLVSLHIAEVTDG